VIDGYGKTNVPGIYAIGDVAGPPMLAHKAEHEAWSASRRSRACIPHRHGQEPHSRLHLLPPAGRLRRSDRGEAKEGGREIRVGRFPFVGNGKAIALGEDQGWSR
jgi:dihydrolipoamide dehydrogenase